MHFEQNPPQNLDLFQETVTPELAAKHIAAVAAHHGKNEKLAWKRKQKKMGVYIENISVFELKILELIKEKQPILDDIAALRLEMVKECIHPKDNLVHMGTYLICKFCNNKISIPRILTVVVEETEEDEGEDVGE